MILFGLLLFYFCYFFLRLISNNDPASNEVNSQLYESERNYTIANILPDDVIETWTNELSYSTRLSNPNELPIEHKNNIQAKHCSKKCMVESMFTPPVEKIEADWSVVQGTFSHYNDENWKEFLAKTDAPLFVRLLVEKMSETIVVAKKPSNIKKGKRNQQEENYTVSLQTTLWLFTHESEFRLRENITEHDMDGTDSRNVFFFSAPRILVHNKYKEKGNVSIVYNFDEVGLNMTLISRDRFIISRRMFERVED